MNRRDHLKLAGAAAIAGASSLMMPASANASDGNPDALVYFRFTRKRPVVIPEFRASEISGTQGDS